MEQYSTLFLQFITSWGYLAIALLMALENACIPIPSELILGFAGYLVFAGKMNFAEAVIAGIIGGMIGSIITYYIGFLGGRPFVEKYGKYFFMKKDHVAAAQKWFDNYGLKAVFFSRMLPVVRTFISLPAGFAKINIKKFIACTFAGSLPWTILIIYIGNFLGENWKKMLAVGHDFSLLICVIIIAVIIIIYIHQHKK
ncbi:DedA family protein [Pectinatus sottacetonis]|uniref:DedA family protein n=1 Tax=Pectinatus sottacetonis TaxID=1002795 RepID=UPI0018C75ACB|nr:DedA family protein [Pectinatus sottacetonis]